MECKVKELHLAEIRAISPHALNLSQSDVTQARVILLRNLYCLLLYYFFNGNFAPLT